MTERENSDIEQILHGPVAGRTRSRFAVPTQSDEPIARRTRQRRQVLSSGRSQPSSTARSIAQPNAQEVTFQHSNSSWTSEESLQQSDEIEFNIFDEYILSLLMYEYNESISSYDSESKSSISVQSLQLLTGEVCHPDTIFECAICLESYVNRKPTTTRCGHIYCRHCLLRWLSVSSTCPKCKEPVTTTSLIRIFP